MSISSCPQCAQPISLPSGVSSSAKVRCPMCRSQYTLADALAKVPPLLEVIDDAPAGIAGAGLDLAPDRGVEAQPDIFSRHEMAETMELAAAPDAAGEAAPLADMSHSDGADAELIFEAPEIEHDDLTMQEQDTEIEDFNFATSDPLVREAPAEVEHLELAGPDEDSVLDLGEQRPVQEEPAHDASTGEGLEIDFDHVPSADMPAVAEEVELDFGEPLAAEDNADQATIELDFDSVAAVEKAAEEAELPLEFGEPIEAESAPLKIAEEPPAEEEKGAKKKKGREKTPPKAGRQGSLVRTLVSLAVCSIVALPLALYGVLWIDKDYDLLGMAGWLPSSVLPPSFAKSKSVKSIAAAPISQPAPVMDQQTGPGAIDAMAPPAPEPDGDQAAGPTESAPTETAVATKSTPGAAPAAADAAAAKSDDAPPEPPAADEGPAVAETSGPAQNTAVMSDKSTVTTSHKPASAPDKPEPAADDTPVAAAIPSEDLPSPFDAVDDSKPSKPEEMPEPTDATEPAEELGPRNAPQLMVADVSAAIEDLKTANKAYVSSQQSTDEAAIKKARAQFYVSLFSLAEAFTFAKDDPSNPQLDAKRKMMQRILLQFFGDEKRVDALGANAAIWLGYSKRNVAGVVFVGTVHDVQQVGKLFHIKVELTSGKPTTVTVVTPEEPKLKANDRALVLGSIVENPAQQIAGYEGEEAAAVWSGMAVPLPAAQ